MKFLCLAYEEEQLLNALTHDDWQLLRQETLDYMDSCRTCGPDHGQNECGTCGINGHEGKAPLLVDGISKT